MSDFSPECAPKLTSVDHSEFMGFTPWRGRVKAKQVFALSGDPLQYG